MVINDIIIKNFRAIEEKRLVFESGLNILKCGSEDESTAILEAIAVGIGGFVAVLNPIKKDCITETSGVVLIDEITRYAGGEVVERATDAFRKVFPNVQFIASMNSVN